MNNIKVIYDEICGLKPKTLVSSISDRLDNILRVYVEELEETESELLDKNSGFNIYKEMSKGKWIRR